MIDHSTEDGFNAQLKDMLDDNLQRLDPVITERLRQNRLNAVARQPTSPLSGLWPLQQRYLAGASAAVVLVLAISLWSAMRPPSADVVNDEIELAAKQGTLDMYRDLDFYQWLAQQHATK